MIAGLILSDDPDMKCQIAFLDEALECIEVETNEEIIEKIEKSKTEVMAVNAGQLRGEGLKDDESELKEEGHAFIPSSHEKKRSKRLRALEDQLELKLGPEKPVVIRFDPQITSKQLALDGDQALEGLGIDTSGIRSAKQFDAALGAVTARFYQQNQYEDLGVIVPEPVKTGENHSERF